MKKFEIGDLITTGLTIDIDKKYVGMITNVLLRHYKIYWIKSPYVDDRKTSFEGFNYLKKI